MPLYRKKPATVEAHQWWRNGDHPEDRVGEVETGPLGDTYERMEGAVVRFFRRPEPEYAGHTLHEDGCLRAWHDHGWIDTLEGGHTVCPGDWIITGVAGERYPCKPDIFAETYEPVGGLMPVTVEVPTGAEMHEHYRRWEALPEDERPFGPFERRQMNGQWEPLKVVIGMDQIPDDDTPQPGYRLVPLPEPAPETERVPWWEAKGRLTPKGEEIDGVRHTFDEPQYHIIWGNAWLTSCHDLVEVLVESAASSEQSPSGEPWEPSEDDIEAFCVARGWDPEDGTNDHAARLQLRGARGRGWDLVPRRTGGDPR